jgi:Elongation factor SelB, winged helix
VTGGPLPDRTLRVAQRRLELALRRWHRRHPLTHSIRTDALVRAVLSAEAANPRPATHRGSGSADLDAAILRAALDRLVAAGVVARDGRRLRLVLAPAIGPGMAERVEQLLGELRRHGASPPRAEVVARRIGMPPAMLDELRRSGSLVALAPGIDYPRDVWERLRDRIVELAAEGPISAARIRDELRTTRRYAEALLRGIEAGAADRDTRPVR